ncbi:copper chaperone PCu(A)C [Thioclava sp. FR2]|uniref:copper chaperone PCu(A)C n=1 Tax=Thioclava sp. FR2 TaxID=3445780 RepID=UPI003EBF4E73
MTRFFPLFAALAASLTLSSPLAAQDHPAGLHIMDPYARAAGVGKSGAVFMAIHNNIDQDDRLIDVRADVAKRVELHTHKDMGDGVMKMMHVPEGFAVPAGEMHELARGGDHVMLMGLTADLKNGDTFPLTLIFEKAGEIVVDVPVDNDRKPEAGMQMQHNHGMQSGG